METVKHWQEQKVPEPADSMIKMESFEVKWFLALNYFDDIYTHFEIFFLYPLDMNVDVQEIFKPFVFNEVIQYDFLHDPNALAKSIAWAIVTLYQEPHRSQVIFQLQTIYDEFVGNPPSAQLAPVGNYDLVGLIQRILETDGK